MKGQDLVVMLKLLCQPDERWTYLKLAKELSMSSSEVHASVKRCEEAGLYNPETRLPMRQALEEFLLHGIRYVFPARLGPITTGLPTSYGAPLLSKSVLFDKTETPVMPLLRGPARGPQLTPLYPAAPKAAQADERLYELLAVVDALRMGRAREKKLAGEALSTLLSSRE